MVNQVVGWVVPTHRSTRSGKMVGRDDPPYGLVLTPGSMKMEMVVQTDPIPFQVVR